MDDSKSFPGSLLPTSTIVPTSTIQPPIAAEDENEACTIKTLELSQKKLHEKLGRTTEQMTYYCKQLKKQEEMVLLMEEECQRKIRSIRSFWKDKIYKEGTRGGKMLKIAMKSKQ